jgi:perosamine synthetase
MRRLRRSPPAAELFGRKPFEQGHAMSKADTPALLGGTPVRSGPLPRYNTIGEEEKRAVMAVLDSGELSGFIAYDGPEFFGGREVRALEEEFCRFFDMPHAVAVNSATSGLHCAVAAMGVGPGDEVICPPYTMSASATAVLMTGAVPVFVDIEARTFCLDPAAVEAAITPYTRGIMAVNLFGHPAALFRLREIADRTGLFLIEDNAQAPAATIAGQYAGTIGAAGIFSFNRHKTMQCGEGGVVICRDPAIARKMQLVRNHGEVVVGPMGVDDIVNTIGLNYRMTEMEAAVARCQFRKLPALNADRIKLADRLTQGLGEIAGLIPPAVERGCTHVYYFYAIRYDESVTGLPRNLFAKAVEAEGFTLRAGYVKPLYLEPLYQRKLAFGPNGFPFTANPRNKNLSYAKGLCPVVERLNERELMVTNILYPPLSLADMDGFVAACRKVLAARDALLDHQRLQVA